MPARRRPIRGNRGEKNPYQRSQSELMDAVKEILLEGNQGRGSQLTLREDEQDSAGCQPKILPGHHLLPPEIAAAHQKGSFYIHGLGLLQQRT